jgi:hypothetical protein
VKDFPTTATYYVWQRQYSGYGSLGVSIDEVSVAGGTRQEAVSAARYFWSEVGAQTITQGSHHVDMTIDGQALDDALIIRAREYESISRTWIHYLGALPADKLDVSRDALANAIMRLNAPYATDMSVTTHKDVPVSGTLAGTDLDGEPLTYVLLSNGARGRIVIMNPRSGAFRYRPNRRAFGTDSFTYKIISDGIESNVGKVTVTIDQVQTPNQGLEREAAKSAAPLSLFR